MHKSSHLGFFEKFSKAVSNVAGSSGAFIAAFGIIILWIVTGPLFQFSDTWQLIINTGTTIITFLMVFLIQRSQNKDSAAVHLKLNELLKSHKQASNRLICIEEICEKDIEKLTRFYEHLAKLEEEKLSIDSSHSIENAEEIHQQKHIS